MTAAPDRFTTMPGDLEWEAELGLASQLAAIELAAGMAWLHELRDAHGEWTRTPADKVGTGLDRYTVPAHERLINPRADHPDPADYPFFKKHPVSADNVIAAYDATPKGLRDAGMHWYSDAHLLAKALAHGNAEEGAILLANYSPQANWPINMFRAARVADEGKPIPAGEGYVNNDQVKKAQKALDGMHIDQVLISPKTRSFAHLLAQGNDSPDDPYGHVVIDAHALNVAAGGDIRGATYGTNTKRKKLPPEDQPPIATDVRAHEYVGDMYRQAAKYISKRDGVLISPHQMQAITWVGQVLANQAEDRAAMEAEGSAKGRLAARAKDWKRWLAYAKGHHFALMPGVSALAGQIAFAQLIELAADDSLWVQLLDLAAWEHELRDSHGRWMKAGGLAPSLVEAERAEPATEGDVRLALIKSQVYTAQQFDRMQAEIRHLQDELDKEGKDEAKAVLATHLAWIGAGIAVALILTGVGAPAAVAVLAGLIPALGTEFSELAVVMGKGRRALAHPVQKFRVLLHQQPHIALAADLLHDQAAAVVAQWLIQTGYTGSQVQQLAGALVSQWMADNADRVATARQHRDMSGSLTAQLLELAFNTLEPRDPKGRWTRTGGLAEQLAGRERDYQRTRTARAQTREYPMIGPEHARGNSRPVSREKFQQLARKGNSWLDKAKRDASPITALDEHWDSIRHRAWGEVQKPWGGATIDAHTGEFMPDGADRYALSVKPRGMVPVHLPETVSEADFKAAMDQAREMFRPVLERQHFQLGVFHDDDLHQIDIDPVAVVDSPDLVEQVGAYTHAVGGAYHFKTGNGYWPPHVAEGSDMAADEDEIHFAGPGEWHRQAVEVQEPEPTDDEPDED